MAHWASEIPGDGNERNDVGGADPGMHSALYGQINQFRRPAGGANGRLHHRQRPPGNGHHRTIVVAVHGPVEQGDALDTHGVHDGVHFLAIGALGEVGHALDDDLVHKTPGPWAGYFHQV